ncbi:MAG: hypothetical protein JO021_08875 [Alphaproteobacteria bacterium]|nr:hypothetical protein [Alphaproteobacteria bacterium]
MALLVIVPPAEADDAVLAQLHQVLAPLRTDPYGDIRVEGSVPAFAPIKRQLRAWVESRLGAFVRDGDEVVLARELSGELFDGDLLCEGPTGTLDDRCARAQTGYSARGFLGEIRMQRLKYGTVLVVRTALGVICGYDESAYVYEWRDERWRLMLEVEEDTSGTRPYLPEQYDSVLVSSPGEGGDRLVLTLGHPPRCSSNWHPVYYRLWRLSPSRSIYRLLLDRSEQAFLPSVLGSLSAHEALIEFRVGSLDHDLHNRPAVRHFRIDGAAVTQIDPIALSPRDFVEEWLTQTWDASERWTDARARSGLERWHERLQGDVRSGEFLDATKRCYRSADVWQVAIRFGDREKPIDAYFLVRWQPPYRFAMVAIANQTARDCTIEDPEADDRRTLFPALD